MIHVYEIAKRYLGLEEYPGAQHNKEIVEFFRKTGEESLRQGRKDNYSWVTDDETPWCAAFVGACLGEAGMNGTGRLNARSYEQWGRAVSFQDARKGDVVVLWRGHPDGSQGHVGFFDSWGTDGETVNLLGGNQGNKVSVALYRSKRILAIRRREAKSSLGKSTTLQATSLAGVGTLASSGVTLVQEVNPITQYMLVGLGAVVLLALLWIARERVKKWVNGDC